MNIQFSSCQLNSLSDWVCHLREIQIIMAFLFLFRKTFNSFSFELEHASPFGAYGHGTLWLEKSVLIVLNWKIQWPFGTVIFIIWRWKHGFCYIYIAVCLLLLISQHGMRMFTRADTPVTGWYATCVVALAPHFRGWRTTIKHIPTQSIYSGHGGIYWTTLSR